MNDIIYTSIPVVPLRGLVVLPGELLHFDAGRDRSVKALKAAVEKDGLVFLTSQKDIRKNEVTQDDIFKVGTLCRVRQTLMMPGESMRVLVQGISRARLDRLIEGDYLTAGIVELGETEGEPVMLEALRRRLDKALREYAQLSGRLTADSLEAISHDADAGAYADSVANAALAKMEARQEVIETLDKTDRLRLVLSLLSDELEILRIDRKISAEVKKNVDKNQREYYLREQLKVIHTELGDDEESEADEFRVRLEKKKLPDDVRAALTKEISRYASLPSASHEMPMMRNYIECVLALPWSEEERSEDNFDLDNARKVLDDEHYGLEKVKERIIEFMAVSKLTGSASGQIICFVGPPGVGKTSISESIAHALGRKFVRMSLGGVRDEAEIRGHRRTYIGAMPGRVIAAMRTAATINPVILFDEIDKLAGDVHGDPSAAMLEVLDSAQNHAFVDHFLDMPYDLSNVMFITTANNRDTIPRPLLDRMEIIEVPSYLETEKREIALRHLLPKQMKKHGLKKSNLAIQEDVMSAIIRGYTREAGVRELERTIAKVCRKAACDIGDGKSRIKLTKQRMNEYLGQAEYTSTLVDENDEVGVVNGLAWTSVGGELLQVETQVVEGSGQVVLTGNLGDVMQESARAALTFIKANAKLLGINVKFAQKDIHVHVPEGAVPKDGPSAGVTMMTAMVSALTGTPVRSHVAMTGEITLRGRVLPIGGLREKLLAAVRAGVNTVLVPKKNIKDLEQVPKEVRDALEIIPVSDAMSVLHKALTHTLRPLQETDDMLMMRDIKRESGAVYSCAAQRQGCR